MPASPMGAMRSPSRRIAAGAQARWLWRISLLRLLTTMVGLDRRMQGEDAFLQAMFGSLGSMRHGCRDQSARVAGAVY